MGNLIMLQKIDYDQSTRVHCLSNKLFLLNNFLCASALLVCVSLSAVNGKAMRPII